MAKKGLLIIAGIIAVLFAVSASGAASLPLNAVFDLSQFDAAYGADNVQRLTNLYYALANAADPNTGEPLSTLQQQLLLAQALHESGLFTGQANYTNIDNLNNFTGIKGNTRYAAAPGSMYAYYPSIPDFVNDWLTILNFNSQPIEASSVPDFVNRLKINGYFEDSVQNYQASVQHYYDLLSNTAA